MNTSHARILDELQKPATHGRMSRKQWAAVANAGANKAIERGQWLTGFVWLITVPQLLISLFA